MNKRIIYSLSIAVVLAACSKKEVNIMNEPNLTGTWLWANTCGGIANHIHETPQSTRKNVELTLTPDSKYTIYTNGNPTSVGTYTVETKKCIHDGKAKSFLNFSSAADTDMMVESLSETTLELSDEASDGLTSLYGRKSSK